MSPHPNMVIYRSCTCQTFLFCLTERNIAVNKPAYQSSNRVSSVESAGRAVDGNRNTLFISGGSCTHTVQELNPWWAVDLQSTYRVNSVKLTNRGDCCGKHSLRHMYYVHDQENEVLSLKFPC